MPKPAILMTKREIAEAILKEMFAGRRRIPIAEARAAALARGVSYRTLYKASVLLGVQEVHNGRLPAFWQL